MGNESTNTNKMAQRQPYKITNPKPNRVIKQQLGKTSRFEKGSINGDLTAVLKAINEENQKLFLDIKNLIVNFLDDTRFSEQIRYQQLQNKLNEICTNLMSSDSITDSEKESIKSKIKKAINASNVKLSDKQKNSIEDGLEKCVEGLKKSKEFKEVDKQIDRINKESASNTSTPPTDTEKINLFKDIISNHKVLSTIQNHVVGYIKDVQKGDVRKFQDKLTQFKSRNKKIFSASNLSTARRLNFKDILIRNRYNIFLMKYNHLILRKFVSKSQDLDKINSMDELRKRLIPAAVRQKIFGDIIKNFKHLKKNVTNLMSAKFLKKELKKYSTQISNWYKHTTKKEKLGSILTGGANLIHNTAMLMFKGAKLALGFGFNVLMKIGSIGKNLLVGTYGVLKNVWKLSVKILGGMVGTAAKLFKYVKWFLFTPQGAYITGFIMGFIKTIIENQLVKIKEWASKKIKDIKEWLKKKDSKWSQTHIVKDEDGKQIKTERSVYGKIKLRFLSIMNTLKKYLSIFTDENKDDGEQFKALLDKDTNYQNGVIEIETMIGSMLAKFKDGELGKQIAEIQDFIHEINDNRILRGFKMLEDLRGTGHATSMAVRSTVSPTVKMIIKIAGASIGSLFGPLGAVIGGAAGGALAVFVEKAIEHYFSIRKYTGSEKLKIKSILTEIDNDYLSNQNDDFVFTLKTEHKKKKEQIQSEIDKLKEQISNEKDQNKRSELEKQKASKEKELEDENFEFGYQGDRRFNEDVLDIARGRYLGTSTDEIFKNLFSNNPSAKNFTAFDYEKEYRDYPDLIEICKMKADRMKYIMQKYGQDYKNGLINKNKYKELVQNEIKKIDDKLIYYKESKYKLSVKDITDITNKDTVIQKYTDMKREYLQAKLDKIAKDNRRFKEVGYKPTVSETALKARDKSLVFDKMFEDDGTDELIKVQEKLSKDTRIIRDQVLAELGLFDIREDDKANIYRNNVIAFTNENWSTMMRIVGSNTRDEAKKKIKSIIKLFLGGNLNKEKEVDEPSIDIRRMGLTSAYSDIVQKLNGFIFNKEGKEKSDKLIGALRMLETEDEQIQKKYNKAIKSLQDWTDEYDRQQKLGEKLLKLQKDNLTLVPFEKSKSNEEAMNAQETKTQEVNP